jgi:hypothetical protein
MPIPAFTRTEVSASGLQPLYLISFSRYPAELRNALLHGEFLEDGRQALKAAGYSHELDNGVKIFCTPGQYPSVEALPLDTYRPYHVIVSAHFLPLVRRTVEGLDRKLKVKIKDEKVIANIPSSLHGEQKPSPLEFEFTPPCSPLFEWQSISDCTQKEILDAWSFGSAWGAGNIGGNITPPWDSLVWAGGLPGLKLDSLVGFAASADAVAAGSA